MRFFLLLLVVYAVHLTLLFLLTLRCLTCSMHIQRLHESILVPNEDTLHGCGPLRVVCCGGASMTYILFVARVATHTWLPLVIGKGLC